MDAFYMDSHTVLEFVGRLVGFLLEEFRGICLDVILFRFNFFYGI